MTQDDGRNPLRILLVCMGNICRSPLAHGVVRQRLRDEGIAARVELDSAGTHGYHAGSPPDERAQARPRGAASTSPTCGRAASRRPTSRSST